MKGKTLFNSGEGQTLHSVCFHCLFPSLSLCLMNVSSTTAPDNTSWFLFFFSLLFDFFSHPDTFSLHFSLADTVFFHQVRMLPPDFFPLLFTADPFSPQRTPSGGDIELGEFPRGFWQPHSPSPLVQLR